MTHPDAPPVLVALENIGKHYITAGGLPPLTVLSGINLRLACGDSAAVTGPSSSGKSTLLNIIGALDSPTSGRVLLEGRNLAELDDTALGRLRNQDIGFVFQRHYLLPQLTVLENVLVPTLASKGNKTAGAGNREKRRKGDLDRAKELLSRVHLDNRLTHRPGRLSGGECQRVALVRALINRPKLLLADEPTGSLDRKASASLMELLLELNRSEKVTLILVTHARGISDQMHHVFELSEGRLLPASKGTRENNAADPTGSTGKGRT